jgi:hypothetical protein
MSVNKALDNILAGKLDEMRSNFSSALSTKAVEKLEERKIEIAQKYFGQMQEQAEQIDEALPVAYFGRPLPDRPDRPLPKFDNVVDKALKSARKKQKKNKQKTAVKGMDNKKSGLEEEKKNPSQKLRYLDAKRRKFADEVTNPDSETFRQRKLKDQDDRIQRMGRTIASKAKSY